MSKESQASVDLTRNLNWAVQRHFIGILDVDMHLVAQYMATQPKLRAIVVTRDGTTHHVRSDADDYKALIEGSVLHAVQLTVAKLADVQPQLSEYMCWFIVRCTKKPKYDTTVVEQHTLDRLVDRCGAK